MSKNVSSVIQANAGQRLVFGLLNPDNDGVFQLEFGFIKPGGQSKDDYIWQPVKVDGNRVELNRTNYPLFFDVMASGSYRLRNMAGDDTKSVPILIEQYIVNSYTVVERAV